LRKRIAAAAVVAALGSTPVKTDSFALVGGMDLVTPGYQRKPGTLRSALNFEAAINGGYRRIDGYERVDGHAKPSDATYSIISANISGSPAVGQTLTGATSGATGVIIALPGGSFVLTKVVGTFVSGENLNVGGPTIAVASSAAVAGSASTRSLNAQYKNSAADQYRNDIAAVPGSGVVRGVFRYNDVVYAFRDNVGATAKVMYKSTASGWQAVAFEYEVSYTVGNGSVDDGDTLTQGGVTATVRRVLVRTGTLAGGTAAGTLVISAPAGGNFAAGAATTTGGGGLTLSGVQTAITLQPGGRGKFVEENFGGSTSTKRIYGCDSVNTAFEWDGSYFVPIHTGMSTDKPTNVVAHKKHLMLSFGSSHQISSIAAPYTWTPLTGASEIGMGEDIVGYAILTGSETAGGALGIYTRNRLSILYGSSSADWSLVPYKAEVGAIENTIQDVGGFPMFLDDRGITDLQTTQQFGNFAHATRSNAVRTLVNTYRSLSTASCISRDLSQYRLFFSDGHAFYVTVVGTRTVGITLVKFPDVVRCAWSSEMNDGGESLLFGSDNGWVYEMNKGTSFDGDAIEFYFDLAYNFCGSPRVEKHFRDTTFEIVGDGYAEFNFGGSLGYGVPDVPQLQAENVQLNLSATAWDGFSWDAFTWDGTTLIPSVKEMVGDAENYSLRVIGNSDYFSPFTVTGVVTHYTPRRQMRATA
jgi:hypothetical protein